MAAPEQEPENLVAMKGCTSGTIDSGQRDDARDGNEGTEQDCNEPAQEVSSENRQVITAEVSEGTQDALTLDRLLLGQSYFWFARVDLDLGWFWGEPLAGEDGFEARRLRAGLAGVSTFFDNVSYKAELDFADDTNTLSDLYVQFDTSRLGSTRVGNQNISQNLSGYTSSLSQLFIERPLPVTAFSLRRRAAISHSYYGNRWGVHGTYFNRDANNDAGKEGWAVRGVFNPVRVRGGIAHLGFSYVTEEIGEEFRYRTRPESKLTDIRLVDTGLFPDVRRHELEGIELAGAIGTTTGRLEMFRAKWKREEGRTNEFKGAYLELGRFLTGQSFSYTNGKFVRPTIDDGSHAWEAGLRVSWVDLTSRDARGGEQVNYGAALNYYWRQNLRVMVNLLRYDTDAVAGDHKGWILQTRIQYNH
jgi:phosphate-selective porin OprO/OprP